MSTCPRLKWSESRTETGAIVYEASVWRARGTNMEQWAAKIFVPLNAKPVLSTPDTPKRAFRTVDAAKAVGSARAKKWWNG